MIRVRFTQQEIARRVRELGEEISKDYQGKTLTVVALLNGALPFAADLIRNISVPVYLDTFAASSYVDDSSCGKLNVRSSLKNSVEGKDVLLVDDILDTGFSLAATVEHFRKMNPSGIRTCVFLDKILRTPKPVKADYTGFPVENAYVVGYGLDSRELYRNLPFIGIMEKEEKENQIIDRSGKMIHVVAEMEIRKDCMKKILALVKELVPLVRAEKGCIQYEPNFAVDDEGHEKYFFFVETWESEEALKNHLASPHMAKWREDVKELRLSSRVKVLTPAGI